jgi:hypothetical protein
MTLGRRVPDSRDMIYEFWLATARDWCRHHSVPFAAMYVPQTLGGLGVMQPPPGVPPQRITPALIGRTILKGLNPTNIDKGMGRRVFRKIRDRFGIDLPKDTIDRIIGDRLRSTLTSDNVPRIAGEARKEWNTLIRRTKYKIIILDDTLPQTWPDENYTTWRGELLGEVLGRLKLEAGSFGSHPEVAEARASYNEIRPDMAFQEWMSTHFPAAFQAARKFHRSWYLGEIYDFLEGTLPIRLKWLHPALASLVTLLTARVLVRTKTALRGMAPIIGRLYEPRVMATSVADVCYAW